MKRVIDELRAAGINKVYQDEPMAEYTTWKIGGPADLFIVPEHIEELSETIKILHNNGVPWMQIGRGSNLLISDKGIRGAVIKLGKGFETIHFEKNRVYVGGAFSFIKLSVLAAKEGLTGLQFASGIPGTVGGAVYMNAGAHGSDMSRILSTAKIVLETGELVEWSADDLKFAYRDSILHRKKGIVAEAVLNLEYGNRKDIAKLMATLKERRLKTQPLQLACAGSVFRNPDQNHAAKLIEQAGLKGTRIGGAEVSTLHSNFIVNTNQATARDVLTLIEHIQSVVYEKYDVFLVPEVLQVGER
ncbi:UDP-N-acetylmuramate dehydrogenase [Chengkuizengella axinellae]|uniref:UDP-N-acetylenolpyruvoylglucosamine reductase n=1 Tax=Chengkuizengella axinellae TaxID=3064388 RepID=A0ABT9IV09_9BACL|nr:UDP-N-acetylmuramate dehydrogenase [Chengkuizengella sp. 2205SS18-9]MDP5273157.1 UDP-N-acetylmuramate dehydrogenase [Chengkuizengella sp. 2205SS18-9]